MAGNVKEQLRLKKESPPPLMEEVNTAMVSRPSQYRSNNSICLCVCIS
jgi:hypothetical protein